MGDISERYPLLQEETPQATRGLTALHELRGKDLMSAYQRRPSYRAASAGVG